MTQPDIVLIILDTVRRDRLSAYGYPLLTTPALDDFARRSTLFERAIAPAQWTVPSHASMFTGLYPTTHQLTQANGRLSPNYATLAEILRGGGYHTVGFCNNPLVGLLDNGLQRGFTEFYNYGGAAPNRPHDMMRPAFRRMLAARWQRFTRRASNQFAHSDWLFRVSLHPLIASVWTRAINYKGSTPHSIDDMTDYLRARRSGGQSQPTFSFLNLMGAHLPYRPPQDFLHRFAPEISRDAAAYRFMRRFNVDPARWASPAETPLSDWEQQVIDGFYRAEIAHQDMHLGRLLRYLEARDNTLVMIAADHGEGHGDHQFFGHSFVVYQELVHVPLVIRDAERFPAGERTRTNVSTRRIFHTALEAAGIQLPEEHAQASGERLSLARAVRQQTDSEAGMAFAEAFPPATFLNVIQHHNPRLIEQLQLASVRRGIYHDSYKLAMVGDRTEALFNVEADPHEMQDLSAGHRPLVSSLEERLAAFVTEAERQRLDGVLAGSLSAEMREHLRALGYLN